MFFNIFCSFFEYSNSNLSSAQSYAILSVKYHFGKLFVLFITTFRTLERLELFKTLQSYDNKR